jgi:hypothetical protein
MRFRLAAMSLLLGGCAYMGDPLPPSLRIPEPVADVRAMQKGSRLLIDFTPPVLTTDGVPLEPPLETAIRIGEAGSDPAEEAEKIIDASPWIGKEVVIGVRTRGPKGRWSGWSNFATLRVREPLNDVRELQADSAPEGISLSWQSGAPAHRVYRDGDLIAEVQSHTYLDATAEIGRKHEYAVEGVDGSAESENRVTIAAVREDRFPPETPSNLTAIAGVSSIELSWDGSPAPDLAFYRVYRNGEGISQKVTVAAFSDGGVQRGMRYRYAVAAVDRDGNESARSSEVEVILP